MQLIILLILTGCGKSREEIDHLPAQASEKNIVKVHKVEHGSFHREIASNGKLVAARKSDLRFSQSLNIVRIYVRNGDRVKRGQRLAELDTTDGIIALRHAEDQLERAQMEYRDILVKMGLDPYKIDQVPKEIVHSARVMSNYNKALVDLQSEREKFKRLVLRSPFDGIVCNLFDREDNLSVVSDAFCSVVDDSEFEAEFSILESELSLVEKNAAVSITPFALDVTCMGQVSRINPIVDENGVITVHARIKNRDRNLYEGMQVKVIVRQTFKDQLLVPNNGIVIRNGKTIAFTWSKGFAKWNDVEVGLRNSSFTVVTKGLDVNDTLIISENVSLNNGTKVEIDFE
jgi:RND family efflux transporter MFP subunit